MRLEATRLAGSLESQTASKDQLTTGHWLGARTRGTHQQAKITFSASLDRLSSPFAANRRFRSSAARMGSGNVQVQNKVRHILSSPRSKKFVYVAH